MVGQVDVRSAKRRSLFNSKGQSYDLNENRVNNENQTEVGPTVENEVVKFKREIGLFTAVAVSMGGSIGSGIFISPTGIVSRVGSVGLSLILWTFCGFFSLLGAFCYAELATAFPSTGGEYTYIYEAFGPIFAFLSLWCDLLIFSPIGTAILALSFARYASQPFASQGCDIEDFPIQLIAAAAICLLAFVNCCAMTKTAKILNVFMVLKITALTCVIAGGIYWLSAGNTRNFEYVWENSNYNVGTIVLASFSGSYAYGGWSSITYLMEEMKEPKKNFPRAVIITIGIVTLVYLLANAAYFAVLTPSEVMKSKAVAVTFFERLVGDWGQIVPGIIALCMLGTLSIRILVASRTCFVGARCGQMPHFLGLLSMSNSLPVPATLFICMLSLIFLYWPDIFVLLEFSGITSSFGALLTSSSLLYLRWKKPDIERPFKVFILVPIVYFTFTLAIFLIPLYSEPIKSAIGVTFTLSAIPVYYLFIRKEKVDYARLRRLHDYLTTATQKLFYAAREDK